MIRRPRWSATRHVGQFGPALIAFLNVVGVWSARLIRRLARFWCFAVACQGDGTTWLPVGWDHRGALLRMLVGVVWVKLVAGALAVGRPFDDQGVGGGGQPVDG